jgi:GR25 family glycosyltransferase involved in LPS biosynthesis
MSVAGFVISLERAAARRPQVERILQMCPIPCQRLAAVDGAALSDAELQAVYSPQLFRPHNPFPRSIGNIGCFLSHRRAWQRLLNDGLSAALILEDDVELDPGFKASLDFALKVFRPGDYVQFQVRDIGEGHPCLVSDGYHALVSPVVAPLRTSAQLVTREAAERLLDTSQRIDRPVDAFLQMTWVTGVPIRIVVPSGIHEVSAAVGGSIISSEPRTIRDRFWRGILRPVYRMRIALMSRRHSMLTGVVANGSPSNDHCSHTKS